MPGNLLHVGAQLMCPHGGTVSIVSSNTRVMVGGQPVATAADTFTIAGCPFQIPTPGGPKPQPCVTIQWMQPALRSTVSGTPPVLSTSVGMCLSAEQIPQGPPTVVFSQFRVTGD